MALGRLLICGFIGITMIGATGCTSTRGCCHKSAPECCPPTGAPVFTGPAAAPAPPPPTQAFSVGPTCALPLQ
jgi:hypothetical protein